VSDRTIVIAAALVALGVRVAYWVLLTADRPLSSDAGQYHSIATNIAEGRGFADTFPQLELHATAFRPPAYPGLLGLVYTVLWPSPGIGRALNVVLGVAVVAMLTALVLSRLGRRPGIAAGAAAALLPNLVANDTYVLAEPLSLLLLVAVLWLVTDGRWAGAGVVSGLLVLSRPSAQYLVPLLVIVVGRRVGWRRGLAFGAIAAMTVAPWVVRNWIELGSPVLVTSNGFNAAALYSPAADDNDNFIDPVVHPAFDGARLAQFDEIAWDRSLREVAVDHVRARPAVVREVVNRNISSWFELQPHFNDDAEVLDGRDPGVRDRTFWLIWPLTILGAWGAWRYRRDPIVVLAAVIGVYFTVASLVLVAPPRLRSPVDLMLIVCATALLHHRAGADRDGACGTMVPSVTMGVGSKEPR
jgi:4-amino-4-deoxy-L-arabinose transferase-like glycosyltransferase